MDTIVVFDPAPGPASGLDLFVGGGEGVDNILTSSALTIGAAPDADRYVVATVSARYGNNPLAISATIGGVSATLLKNRWHGAGAPNAHIFIANVPTGTTAVVAIMGDIENRIGYQLYSFISASGYTVVDNADFKDDSAGTLDVNTTAGACVIAAMGTNAGASAITPTGVTTDLNEDFGSGVIMHAASAEDVSAETPRTVRLAATGGQTLGVSVSLRRT